MKLFWRRRVAGTFISYIKMLEVLKNCIVAFRVPSRHKHLEHRLI